MDGGHLGNVRSEDTTEQLKGKVQERMICRWLGADLVGSGG